MTPSAATPPRCMLLGRDRLFYGGFLGQAMQTRRLGAVAIYAAPEREIDIRVAGGPWRARRLIALAPYTPHRLRSDSGQIANLCLEPESLDRDEIGALVAAINEGEDERLGERIVAARWDAARFGAGGFSTRAFDEYFLGRALRGRALDGRVRRVLDRLIDAPPGEDVSADACAALAGLSTSRFLHLFKSDVDVAFRSTRMWKRARRFMDHANRDDSLTGVALGLGYPDSSHFSHSIRACYGLQPRSIRRGSRGLNLLVGENYALSSA